MRVVIGVATSGRLSTPASVIAIIYYYANIYAVYVTRDPHNKLMIYKLAGLLFSSYRQKRESR